MGTPGLVAWIAANKIIVACTAAAVVTTGGAVVVVAQDVPPTVSVDALEAAPETIPPVVDEESETPEPEAPASEAPAPVEEPKTVEEPVEADEVKVEQVADERETDDAKTDEDDDEPAEKRDEAKDDVRDERVDLAVTARTDGSRVVAKLHNLGDATSGRVKVKLQTRGADAAVRVLEHDGAAECGSWYCWFDAAPPGENVGTVVFSIDRLACTSRDGGAKVIAHYEGDDADWDNNYAWAALCEDADLEDGKKSDDKKHDDEKHDEGATDLRLTLRGGPDEFVATVHNDGPAVAGRVKVKMHGVEGAKGSIRVLGTTGPVAACDGWYCYFEGLSVGEAVASVRFGVDVETCWHGEGGATVEVHTDQDRNHGNDTRWAWWCEGHDVEGQEKAELAVDVEGTAASYRVRVTNHGDAVARNVQFQHWIKDGEASVTLLEASPARCVAEGCEVGDLAPGASAWIRVSADVDCDLYPDTRAKGYVEGVDHAYLDLC